MAATLLPPKSDRPAPRWALRFCRLSEQAWRERCQSCEPEGGPSEGPQSVGVSVRKPGNGFAPAKCPRCQHPGPTLSCRPPGRCTERQARETERTQGLRAGAAPSAWSRFPSLSIDSPASRWCTQCAAPLPPPIQNVHGASSAVAASESGGKKYLGVRHGHRHVPEATRTHLAFASRWNHPFLFPLKSPSVCSGARRLTRFSGLKAVFGQITHMTCRLENTPDLQEGFACRST